ncbi:unnamed protein product [Phytophthora lilii]|uniref:Unnamed protein product n=1 Tax=Phytophthora lilii TaxID=2077276 RepID=A0A9W6TTU3_9STRA|nr:unnamed protein product [Phytophthora lilii]
MPATSSSTGRRARGKAVAADARTHGNSLLQQAPAGGGVTAKAQRRCSAAAVATLASPWRVVQIRHFGNIGLACSTKIGFFGAVAACRQKKPVMDKNLDQVLPPDSAAKLLRVFCFLRQHERKARIARKTAELNAWRAPPPPDEYPAEEELQQASPTESLDKTDLVDELNLLASSGEPDGPVVVANRSKSAPAGIRNVTGAGAATMQELRSEIKELQKEVIASSSDTSGVITAADLSSCMKSLHRVSAKVGPLLAFWRAVWASV